MSSKVYTILGWVVWQLAKREIVRNRVKIGAGGVVALVLVGGVVAARAGSSD